MHSSLPMYKQEIQAIAANHAKGYGIRISYAFTIFPQGTLHCNLETGPLFYGLLNDTFSATCTLFWYLPAEMKENFELPLS